MLASGLHITTQDALSVQHERDALRSALRTAEEQLAQHRARADEALRASDARAETIKDLTAEVDAKV